MQAQYRTFIAQAASSVTHIDSNSSSVLDVDKATRELWARKSEEKPQARYLHPLFAQVQAGIMVVVVAVIIIIIETSLVPSHAT